MSISAMLGGNSRPNSAMGTGASIPVVKREETLVENGATPPIITIATDNTNTIPKIESQNEHPEPEPSASQTHGPSPIAHIQPSERPAVILSSGGSTVFSTPAMEPESEPVVASVPSLGEPGGIAGAAPSNPTLGHSNGSDHQPSQSISGQTQQPAPQTGPIPGSLPAPGSERQDPMGGPEKPPRPSSFISQFNGSNPTFQLPPVQFDPAMDRRRQNLSGIESPPVRAEDAVARLKKIGGPAGYDSQQGPPTSQPPLAPHAHTHALGSQSPVSHENPESINHLHHHHHHHHRHHHHHHHHDNGDLSNENSPTAQQEPHMPPSESANLAAGDLANSVPGNGYSATAISQPRISSATPLPDVSSHPHDQASQILNSINSLKRPAERTKEELPPSTVRSEIIVDNSDVLEAAKRFPRRILGSIIYQLPVKSSDVLFPRYDDKINSTLQIRIPRRFLNHQTNLAVSQRKVWGTDIYTDDSDVVAALYHTGYLKLADPLVTTVVDESTSPLTDCIATIIILPRLEKYHGSYRYGMNSRTWLTAHDGVSFMIDKVEFVPCGQAEASVLLKKQRLSDWNMLRKISAENNPEFRFSAALVEKVRRENKKATNDADTNSSTTTTATATPKPIS